MSTGILLTEPQPVDYSGAGGAEVENNRVDPKTRALEMFMEEANERPLAFASYDTFPDHGAFKLGKDESI